LRPRVSGGDAVPHLPAGPGRVLFRGGAVVFEQGAHHVEHQGEVQHLPAPLQLQDPWRE
ncbi:unnamed protein product, partial [Prorocentrum cordatum]